MKTTVRDIAEAMGDEKAAGAVAELLKREEYEYVAGKIVKKVSDRTEIFKDFKTNRPLERLADLQRRMSTLVVQTDSFESAELVAGVDVSYGCDHAYGVCAILDRDLHTVDIYKTTMKVSFPYISGYLAFREGPVIEALVERAAHFDVLIVNGHGVAHPRGCGLASQVGVEIDRSTIGVASRLTLGRVESQMNGWSPVKYRERIVGAMLKRKGFSTVYVSIGHKISLETAVGIVKDMQVIGGIPEPIRVAHVRALEMRNADERSA
jgi:deoxyribonuclease V